MDKAQRGHVKARTPIAFAPIAFAFAPIALLFAHGRLMIPNELQFDVRVLERSGNDCIRVTPRRCISAHTYTHGASNTMSVHTLAYAAGRCWLEETIRTILQGWTSSEV